MSEDDCTHDCGHVPEGYAITRCPYCHISGIARRPEPRPEFNAIMCDSCGEWVTWDEEAGELGKPAPEHLAMLADNEQARKVRRVWVERRSAADRAGTERIEDWFQVFWRESFMGKAPPVTDDDGFQLRLSFFSGILAVVEMLGAPNIEQAAKAALVMHIRDELGAFFDYADARQPSDEAH